MIQRCSKVFAGYKDAPLAHAIQRLKIGAEQKGFGRDVIGLIRVKNDYKHDRGPSNLGDIMAASDQVQAMLRRCMEALIFFADYPMRREEAPERGGEARGSGLFLDMGGNQVSLWPFILPTTCPRCEVEEICFIDAWETRKGTARMKSFERGHTMLSKEVSEALSEWRSAAQSSPS